ncbi:MAG: molybdopterin-dependent oxidoreductase, partial [Chloroflexi bacterium]|nr:molybdopterin-dependent oxidoreductase [Chloroflexota bacterium]
MSERQTQSDIALTVIGPPRWTPEPDPRGPNGDPATLLTMDRDGSITAFSGKVEYGQGIRNGFVMEIADELDVPVGSVNMILGDTDLVPQDRGTTGSASTRTVGIQLRRAAATARRALLELAATRLEVDAASLVTRDGRVVVTPGNLFVTISQSGETADTLAALRVAKDIGYLATLTICNVATSSVVRESDLKLMIQAGVEVGVA